MGDWHPEFRQFVPKGIMLDFPGAQGVQNGLHIFIASLENGRPAARSESRTERLSRKYRNVRQCFIFDRPLLDLYTIVVEPTRLSLVTVTAIEEWRALRVLDDPSPPVRFSDVREIELPYLLGCTMIGDPEFESIRTPAGRELRLIFNGSHPVLDARSCREKASARD